jgi:hypothetical protein
VLDLGAAARFCIQKADEFIKEISAATSFNPYEVTNTTNNGVHPYRSLPQGSKLL